MASLLGELQESGSRLEDGSPNTGGRVWFFIPGTTSPVNVYTDADQTAIATQPVVLDDGGRIPTADYPDGIWLTQRVRLYVEDSGGGVVADTTYTPADAGNSALESDYYTGTTVEEALDAIGSSLGGVDGKYLQSLGATPRTIHDKFQEAWISVKDKGAIGDGVSIDTTAVQAAVNAVIALGGGIVYFPPGTYKVDQEIVVSAGSGVTLLGVKGSTIVRQTNATANGFTFSTSAVRCGVEGIIVMHATSSTGAGISVANGERFLARNAYVVAGDFAYGIDFSGATDWTVADSTISGNTRGIRSNTTAVSASTMLINSDVGGVTAPAIELNGSGQTIAIIGGFLGGTKGILFNAAYTGSNVVMVGCRNLATLAFDLTGLAADPKVYQHGNGTDTSVTSGATGVAQTPVFLPYNRLIFAATSGGAGTVVVNAPALLPATAQYWDLVFINAAGGAVTWDVTTATVYKFAAAVPTTAAHTISIRVYWDGSAFREASRADTVT